MDALTLALDAAHQAGELILRHFRQPQEIHRKGPADIVTQADRDAEDTIVATIGRAFPHHGFLGEEGHTAPPDAEYVWVIDPLDGTRNYANGIPFFCTSIALTRQGQTVLGVIYDPIRNETFHAEAGRGACLDGRRVHVSGKTETEQAIISLSLLPVWKVENPRLALPILLQLQPLVDGVRNMGSAALHLAYVACGRLDVCYQDYLNAWDMMAGTLLVQEAGGIATDFTGKPISMSSHDIIAASNPAFHSVVLRIAQEVLKQRESEAR